MCENLHLAQQIQSGFGERNLGELESSTDQFYLRNITGGIEFIMRKVIKGRTCSKELDQTKMEAEQSYNFRNLEQNVNLKLCQCLEIIAWGKRELQAGYHSCNILQENTWKMLFVDCEAGLELG